MRLSNFPRKILLVYIFITLFWLLSVLIYVSCLQFRVHSNNSFVYTVHTHIDDRNWKIRGTAHWGGV